MRIRGFRSGLCAAAAACALAAPVALAENPVSPVDGGTAVGQCYASTSAQPGDPSYRFCRTVEQLADGAAAWCRTPLREAPDASLPEWCGVFDGREVSEARVAAYEQSWVHRALTLQRALDAGAPFWEEQLGHTHNSFNASSYYLPTDGSRPSYYPTLTNQDPNQVYSLTDQLRMDIRALEIDVHWVPSPYGTPATHGYWPTMCHGDGQDPTGSGLYVHIGCSYDRPLQSGLAELRLWLRRHPGEFVLLYLENQLYPGGPVAGAQQAHQVAASIIRRQLGRLVYRPTSLAHSGDCASMPYDDSRAQLLAMHKQVLIVGNCGFGAWNDWVFTRGSAWNESGDPTHYTVDDCARDGSGMASHSVFRRWYQDSTWLTAMTGGGEQLTPDTTARMVACGVNIIGFDQLQPFDGRLAAMVWSWAQDEPGASGDCAFLGGDARFHAADCGAARHFACADSSGVFHVTVATGEWSQGSAACAAEFPGSAFGVPPNGLRDSQLVSARATPSDEVWLAYHRADNGDWVVGA